MNPNTKILSQLACRDDVEICLTNPNADPSSKDGQYDPLSFKGEKAFATPKTIALMLDFHLIRQHAPCKSPPTYRLTLLGKQNAASCLKWVEKNESS
jgi:hypothetical protein